MAVSSGGRLGTMLAVIALSARLPAAANPAAAGAPVLVASASSNFDQACVNYYSQGNDPDVMSDQGVPEQFCMCLADYYDMQGLGFDALEFYARTLSEDLTTFIHEYPQGDYWMDESFKADKVCKTTG